MSVVQEPIVKWSPEQMVEVVLGEPDDFLKVRETLTRIGVSSRREKKLFQSCHILHKQGKYYITHFKELFALDGKDTNLININIYDASGRKVYQDKWVSNYMNNNNTIDITNLEKGIYLVEVSDEFSTRIKRFIHQ